MTIIDTLNIQVNVKADVSPPLYLNMNKDELYPHLASGAVAGDWWNLSSGDRRELALRIIEWWTVSLGNISHMGKTDAGDMPDWNPYTDPHDIKHQWDAICGYEVAIRYCILDGRKTCPKNLYYYRSGWSRWEQMWKPDGFGLPFHNVGSSKGSFAHWICTLQVAINVSDFSSWVFFQYHESNITPGSSWQMPTGAYVKVNKYSYTTSRGHAMNGSKIAEWNV